MHFNIQRSHTRTAKWGMIFSYITQAQGFILGIVLVPLYLIYIPLDEYGAWLASGNILFWITLIDPGVNNVVRQRVAAAYGKHDVEELVAYSNAGVLINSAIAVGVLVFGLGLAQFLGSLLNLSYDLTKAIVPVFETAVIGTTLIFASYGISAISSGLQSSLGTGLVVTSSTFGYIGVILFCLLNGFGLSSLAYGTMFRGLMLLVGHSLYLLWRLASENIRWGMRLSAFKEIYSLSFYTFAAKSITGLNANIGLFLVTRFAGAEFAPVYALTTRVPRFCKTFVTNPINVFIPIVAHLHGEGDRDKIRKNLLRLANILCWVSGAFFFGFVSLNEKFVEIWVGSEFYAGFGINFMVCLNIIIGITIYCMSSLAFAVGDIKKNNLVQFIQAVVVLLSMYLGIKYQGVLGMQIAIVLPQLGIGLVYFMRTLPRSIHLDRDSCKGLVMTAIKTVIAGIVASIVCIFDVEMSGIAFSLLVATFLSMYGALLLVTSKTFRQEFLAFVSSLQRQLKKLFSPSRIGF